MSYSAKDLFPDHYTEGIKRDASPEELKSRRLTLERLIPGQGILIWIIYLKIYLGIIKDDNEAYLTVVDEFKKDDENFLVKNNNLLRLLLGLLIIEKIEENKTYISDFLAISIITHSLAPQEIFPKLYSFAANFWVEECERKRRVAIPTAPEKLKSSITKIALPAVTGPTYPDTASFQAFSTTLAANLTALVKDNNTGIAGFNLLVDYTTKLQSAYNSVAEESNVLWWLFGGYSDTLKKSFQILTPEGLSIILAIELASLTKIIPGIGKIENIISKPLSMLPADQTSDRPLGELIAGVSTYADEIKKALPAIDQRLISFCPFLFGLHATIEYVNDEWKGVFTKSTGINLENSISLQVFSSQLYKELSLIRIFKTFKITE